MNAAIQIEFRKRMVRDFVSILIPVEDDVRGLEVTLQSLKEQDFDQKRFEILVGNDGDSAQIGEVCQQFTVGCFSSKEKIGSYAMRNLLITQSKGEVLAFIDAQTKASSTWLSQGFEKMKTYDYVGGAIQVITDPNERVAKPLLVYQQTMTFDVEEYMHSFQFASTTNLFVRRLLVEKMGGFDSRLTSSGDLEYGNRVLAQNNTTSTYEANLLVFHLTRTFSQLTLKQKRIAFGHFILAELYKRRFSKFRANSLILFIRMVLPPFWILRRKRVRSLSKMDKLSVFVIHYWISCAYHFYRIQAIFSAK